MGASKEISWPPPMLLFIQEAKTKLLGPCAFVLMQVACMVRELAC